MSRPLSPCHWVVRSVSSFHNKFPEFLPALPDGRFPLRETHGHEDHDLAHSDPDRVASMRESLTRLRAKLSHGRIETRQRLSEADEHRLRALGYIETRAVPQVEQDSP